MDGFFIANHWFAFVLLVLAGGLGAGALVLWQRRTTWFLGLLLPAAALALAGIGGLTLPPSWGLWIGLGALAILFIMALIVGVTSRWLAPLGFAATGLLFLGLGGAVTVGASHGLLDD